jgi:hypothetical protein
LRGFLALPGPRLTGLERSEPLDDPPLRALHLIDLKSDAGQVVERIAEQMIGLEANRQGLKQPLAASHERGRAAHVLQQQ